MEDVRNHWIDENRKELNQMKRALVEQSYAGQEGPFNYMRIHNIIGGCLIEILKLQRELNNVKEENTTLTKKVGKLSKVK